LFFEKDKNDENGERELDPLIPQEIIAKAKKLKVPKFQYLMLESGAFTVHELARKVHLNFVLNIIATCELGWYNRNTGVARLLDSDDYDFDEYAKLSGRLEQVADFISKMNLKANSYWMNKANLYSLIIVLWSHFDQLAKLNATTIHNSLKKFEVKLPATYALAAKEAVNNKKERMARHELLEATLFPA
jgi:hypothetical protein